MSVVKHSVVYLGSSVLNKSIPFLLLPILTKYLSPSEYGTLAIFQLIVTFHTAFIGMNLHMNISKNFFKYSHEQIAKLIGNILFVLSLSTLLFFILVFVITLFFDEVFSIPAQWIQLMPILSFMFMVNTMNLTILRNEGKAYTFGIFEIANTAVNMSVTVLLLVIFHYGWYSQAIGITTTYFLFFTIGFIYMKKRNYLSFELDRNEIRSILMLSMPLIPHVLGGIVIAMSDRLFIEKMVSLEMVGIYSIGYMFGMIVMLFTDAFTKAWSPWFYKSLANPTDDKKIKIVRYSYIYILSIFILAIFISLIAELIMPYFVNEKFYQAKEFILWIALGYAVHGTYKIFFLYLVHISKTLFLAISTITAALVNLVLNYVFIKAFGAIGAAYATIAAFSISATLVFWYQNKNFYMPWGKF